MQVECQKCKYKMDKDEIPKRCPYCGEFGTMRAKRTASDILSEVESNGSDD